MAASKSDPKTKDSKTKPPAKKSAAKKSATKKPAASPKERRPSSFPPTTQRDQPGDEHRMMPRPAFEAPAYRGSGKLDGKKALITGGDSGIGRAVAVLFAREGADIAVVYYDEDTDAQATRAAVEAEGRRCHLIRTDIAEEEHCRAAVEEAVRALGGLHVLVNNAAVQYPKDDVRKIDAEQLERTFRVNLFAQFHFCQAALEHLSRGAAIVNTASVLAFEGSGGLMDYAATKAGIVNLTRSLSANLAERGIRVNAVAPGPIWTPLIVATFDREKVASFGSDVPMGRAGQPEEVAPAFVFLASDATASYITGQTIHVNGGTVMP